MAHDKKKQSTGSNAKNRDKHQAGQKRQSDANNRLNKKKLDRTGKTYQPKQEKVICFIVE